MKKLFLLLILSVVIFSCSNSSKDEKSEETRKMNVQVLKVDESSMPSMRTFSAAVSSDKVAVLSPKVVAYIDVIHVNPGDEVKAGDLLVTLRSDELQDKLKSAKSSIEEAETGRKQAEIGLRMAGLQQKQAQYDLELAEKTYNRYSNLLEKSSVSRQEFDQVEAKYKQAREAHNIAVQNVELAQQNVNQVLSKKRQAVSGYAEVSRYVDYLEIRAPFDGVVLERVMDSGNLASPQQPVLKVGNKENVIYANVSEMLINDLKVGSKAKVTIDSLGTDFESEVLEINPNINASTGNFLVKLRGHGNMINGMYAKVRFEIGKDDVIMVPDSAVVKRGQLTVIFVSSNNTADMRVVKTGRKYLGWTEILSGLEKGEFIVIKSAESLKNGDKLVY